MRSRFAKKDRPAGLMLTSLLDMFTIILIFLIVSFEAEDYEFKLNPDLTLPESSARSVFKPALNVAVSTKDIEVEQKSIYDLEGGRFTEADYDAGEVKPLVDTFKTYYERWDTNQDTLTEAELAEGPIILVQADKDVDYRTLYLVLRSASIAGFAKYRLAIMKK